MEIEIRPTYSGLMRRAWASMQPHLALIIGLSLLQGIVSGVSYLLPILGWSLSVFLAPGYVYSLKRIVDTGELTYKDYFWIFLNLNRFVNFLLLIALIGLIVAVGTLFLIIPGIYFYFSLFYGIYFFILGKPDALDALRSSYKMSKNRWWYIFGFIAFCSLLNFLGFLACGVGYLISCPLTTLMQIYVFESLQGPNLQGAHEIASDM